MGHNEDEGELIEPQSKHERAAWVASYAAARERYEEFERRRLGGPGFDDPPEGGVREPRRPKDSPPSLAVEAEEWKRDASAAKPR